MSLTNLYQKFESLCEANKFRTFTLAEIKMIINDEIKEIMEKNKTTNQFTFGKYRGKSVEDIAKLDKPYLAWVDRQPWFSNFTELKTEVQKYCNKSKIFFFHCSSVHPSVNIIPEPPNSVICAMVKVSVGKI